MAQISYDEVNLMLRLYDMRREERSHEHAESSGTRRRGQLLSSFVDDDEKAQRLRLQLVA